jgi:Ca2+-binding RTX toxin-like protein
VHLLVGPVRSRYVNQAASVPDWGVRPAGDRCTIEGTIREETLVGTAHRDVICGNGGGDTIRAGAGNDVIYAVDHARGVIDGGPGRDTAYVDRKEARVTHVEVKR